MKLYFYTILFLFSFTTLAFGESIIGYEYYVPKSSSSVLTEARSIKSQKEETERYEKFIVDSPSLKVEDKGVARVIRKEVRDHRSTGVTSIFIRSDGDVPEDYSYSTIAENNKKIEKEKQRLRLLQEQELEEKAKSNLGL